MSQSDEQAALNAVRMCSNIHYEPCDYVGYREGPCRNCVAIARLILAQRVEAVEAARPEIEREARVDALESVVDECYDTEQHVREIIKAEIARLRAEGGSDATGP